MATQTIASLKRQRTKRLIRLGARAYYLRRRGREQEIYDLLCNEFLSLGGVYVKFLQGVLFSTPIMKRWHSPAKLKIFENLDYEPVDVVQILRSELKPEQLSQIVLIDPTPFAAGSFGQVYIGQHANGQKIIIKVLRPMIRELLKYDLRLLNIFGRHFAAQEYSNISVKMSSALKEFRTATLNETDYVAEAAFANELYEAYENNPTIVIPRTYMDLCTPHVIVQEYIDGISGVELLKIIEAGGDADAYVKATVGSDLNTQLRAMGKECLVAAFNLPRIQGDPHPGNLRFMTNNRVGIIDFGIAAPSPRNRPAFYGLVRQWAAIYMDGGEDIPGMFEQFLRFFVNDLYRALKKLSSITPGAQALKRNAAQYIPGAEEQLMGGSNDLVSEIGKMIQGAFHSATGAQDIRTLVDKGQMVHAFSQAVNQDNRMGLVIRLESSEILRASQTFIGFLEGINRRAQLFPEILLASVAEIEEEHPDIIHDNEKPVSANQAISIVNHWLERVALRDPTLFMQLMRMISPRESAARKEKTGDA